jgi:UDP-glucose 4-epimerase
VAALQNATAGVSVYNLGTGNGVSVLELVHAFEQATGITIPYQIAPRRPGDVPTVYASAQKALDELGWQTHLTIQQACADSWHWQSSPAAQG